MIHTPLTHAICSMEKIAMPRKLTVLHVGVGLETLIAKTSKMLKLEKTFVSVMAVRDKVVRVFQIKPSRVATWENSLLGKDVRAIFLVL